MCLVPSTYLQEEGEGCLAWLGSAGLASYSIHYHHHQTQKRRPGGGNTRVEGCAVQCSVYYYLVQHVCREPRSIVRDSQVNTRTVYTIHSLHIE